MANPSTPQVCVISCKKISSTGTAKDLESTKTSTFQGVITDIGPVHVDYIPELTKARNSLVGVFGMDSNPGVTSAKVLKKGLIAGRTLDDIVGEAVAVQRKKHPQIFADL